MKFRVTDILKSIISLFNYSQLEPMGNKNLYISETPGRTKTQFRLEFLIANRYRSINIVRYRHLRELRKPGWNISFTYLIISSLVHFRYTFR